MTYNWNTMVDITVPTGTNGWLYSGEVIINGIKVRFPVGVPTSVPEPAAVLLKKMIELEQEEDENTAKPQNHYVGDVTIPAGKTLTIEAGAKFVDNSAPTEVVILPETELTYSETDDGFILTSPWTVDPVVGGVYVVTYNGADYECEGVAFANENAPDGVVLMGNVSLMGQSGGNADAPFSLMCLPNATSAEAGIFSMLVPTDGATSVTLSIVQTEGASADSGSGGGFLINATMTSVDDATMQMTFAMDKTFAETLTAIKAGQYVSCHAPVDGMFVLTVAAYGDETIIFTQIMNTTQYLELIFSADESATCQVHNE